MARLPRGQGWILVLFIGCALLGVALVGAAKTFERGIEGGALLWSLLPLAGVAVGAYAYHRLRRTHHRQEP